MFDEQSYIIFFDVTILILMFVCLWRMPTHTARPIIHNHEKGEVVQVHFLYLF